MELGFDAKRLFCNFTGLGNYSRTLVKNLQHFFPECNYNLYTPKAKKNEETSVFFDEEKFKIHTQGKNSFNFSWRSFGIKKELKKDKIQIYHGLSNEIPYGIEKTGIKTIVTIHDLIFKHFPNTYQLIDRKIYDIKFKYACQKADIIIAISNSTKNDIISFYKINPDKIKVIYQPCNPLFYKLKSDEENKSIRKKYNIPNDFILYVGSIEKRKNLKTLLKAYSLLPHDLKIPLVIVGKGKNYKKECIVLAKELSIYSNTVWIDFLVNNQELQSFYQSAKLLVYPSLYEGFGLPVAEALLSKTPVITSNNSSLSEAGGKNSIYINPENPDELSDAIITVLSNSNLNELMKQEGYDFAHNKFGIEKTTNQIMKVYQSLL